MGLRAPMGLKKPGIILVLLFLSSSLMITAVYPGPQRDRADHSERVKDGSDGGAETGKTAEMTDIQDIKGLERVQEALIPDLPPDEMAFQQLKALENTENQVGRLFYFRLSAILREYIKGRYGINATELTTEELLPKIDEQDLNRKLKIELRTLLHSADPIKFAGGFAGQDRMKHDLEFVKEFVLQTGDGVTG